MATPLESFHGHQSIEKTMSGGTSVENKFIDQISLVSVIAMDTGKVLPVWIRS